MSQVPEALRSRLLAVATAATLAAATATTVALLPGEPQPSPAVQLAMELGAHYESSGRHIGQPYRDNIGKGRPWTVCNGVTGAGVVPGRWYTPADCRRLELPRYQQAEREARGLFRHWPTYNVWVQASLIDMLFNVGAVAVQGSTLQRLANAGDLTGACEQMPRWVYGTVNGQRARLPGLVNRRATTRELCAEWGRDGHFSAPEALAAAQ